MIFKSLLPTLRRWWHCPVHLTSQAAYRLWSEMYPPHAHNPFMVLEEALMLQHVPVVQDQTLLDLACGTGRYTRLLRERGAQMLSLDHSLEMLRRGTAPQAAQAEMTALPLAAGSVDGIVCGLAIGHVADLQGALGEMGRVLRTGGFALLTDLHPALKDKKAQRTFQAQGKTYAVEHYWHSEADYRCADTLELIGQHSAALPERPHDPLVWLIHLRKRG